MCDGWQVLRRGVAVATCSTLIEARQRAEGRAIRERDGVAVVAVDPIGAVRYAVRWVRSGVVAVHVGDGAWREVAL